MGDKINRKQDGVLLQGAAILGVAAVVSKMLGALQKIPLQNIAGDEVFGVYNAVYPLYALLLTVAIIGLPTAVSKFVAERTALGQHAQAGRILRIAAAILCVSGAGFFGLLYFAADWLAWLMGIPRAAPAVRSVSFALLLAPPAAALRGYFQGLQNMMPTAVSQVAEQFLRVTAMIVLLLLFTRWDYSAGTVAAGATFGSVAGAACGFMVMLYYWQRYRSAQRRTPRPNKPAQPGESTARLIAQFMRYALPIGIASVMLPLLTAVDSFTMPRLLRLRHLDEMAVLHQLGVYNHGLPFVQLVMVIVTSMAVALVPSIAEAKARGEAEAIRARTKQALRMAWLMGWPASLGLAFVAAPLNVAFFRSSEGWSAIVILAFTALPGALTLVSGAILQGLGSVLAPARHLCIAVVLKIGFNLLFVPRYGIEGAALAAVLAFAAACLLNLLELRRQTRIGFRFIAAVRPAVALAIMCGVLWCSIRGLQAALHYALPQSPVRLRDTLASLASVGLAAGVYVAGLWRFGVIAKEDIKLLKSAASAKER